MEIVAKEVIMEKMTAHLRNGQRGNTLFLLLISFVGLLFTVAMLTASQSGVIFSRKIWAESYSERMADSAIYATISSLKEGKVEFKDDVLFEVEPKEVYGVLTFDKDSGRPYSTNNLVGNSKVTGWNGQLVPPKVCHLVAVGHYHGFTVVREAFIKDPPFPYSLASAGRIEGEHLEVFGLADGKYSALKPGENLVIEEKDKQQSEVLSNSPGASDGDSIVFRSDVKVTGHVKAVGNIETAADTQIQGMLLPQSAEQSLPDVNISELDPKKKDGVYEWDNSFTSVVGRARHTGNLTVGDLELADGLLFVEGDLTVTGTIKGKGALVATGKITVTGSMDTQSDNAALVAGGDITIRGQGPASSRFQGLVYSEGSVDISKTTIIGAAVSKAATGVTKLEEVKAIQSPDLTSYKIVIHPTLEKAKKSSNAAIASTYTSGGSTPAPIGIRQADGTFTQLAPNGDNEALQALGELLGNTDPPGPNQTWQMVIRKPDGTYSTDVPAGMAFDFQDAQKNWANYVNEHKTHQVNEERIIDIDFNRLLNVDYNMQMLYHSTVSRTEEN